MSTAPLVRPWITYEDLCRLPPDVHRYEILDGEVYMAAAYTSFGSPSPGCRHQMLLGQLLLAFAEAIEDRSEVFPGPLDVLLDEATCLQPDLIFIAEGNLGVIQEVIRGTPDLIVEILSPATALRDRSIKVQFYARHGISEYWLVDPEAESIEILRLDPEAGAYRLASSLRAGDRATTPLVPALVIDLSQHFQP